MNQVAVTSFVFAWVMFTIFAIRTDNPPAFVLYTFLAAASSAGAAYLYIGSCN